MKNSSDFKNFVPQVCSTGNHCPQLHHSLLLSINPNVLKSSHLGTGFCCYIPEEYRAGHLCFSSNPFIIEKGSENTLLKRALMNFELIT